MAANKVRSAELDGVSLLLQNAPDRFSIEERFLLRPGINANRDVPATDTYNTAQMQLGIDKNPHFEVAGTNMTSALATISTSGGVTLTTAGASADQGILQAHTNSAVSAWNSVEWLTNKEIAFRAKITTGAAVTQATIWAGFKLTNTSVVATDNDQVMFRVASGASATTIDAVHSSSGTDTTVATSTTIAAATTYDFLIHVDADRIARFYINGELAHTATSALTTAVALKPFVGVQATEAAAKAITVRYLACARAY